MEAASADLILILGPLAGASTVLASLFFLFLLRDPRGGIGRDRCPGLMSDLYLPQISDLQRRASFRQATA